MNPKIMIITIVWSIVLILIVRAINKGRLASAPSRRIMLQVFLSCLALTLWGEDREQVVDTYLGVPDFALYVKGLALIWTTHLFDLSCRSIVAERSNKHKWTQYLAPSATVMAVLTYVIYHNWQPVPHDTLRYLIIAGRDFTVALFVLFSLIPSVAIMHQREKIVTMRVKFVAIQTCSLCFMVTTASSLVAACLAVLQIGYPEYAAFAGQPFVLIGISAFIVMIIPFRWIVILFNLERFLLLHRLDKIEALVLQDIEGLSAMNTMLIESSADLELALYRKLIMILDFYPMLAEQPEGSKLFEAIRQRISKDKDYNTLVREIAWVRL